MVTRTNGNSNCTGSHRFSLQVSVKFLRLCVLKIEAELEAEVEAKGRKVESVSDGSSFVSVSRNNSWARGVYFLVRIR